MSDPVVPPIGTLTDRVQLLRRDMTAEDGGGHLTLYVPMAKVWSLVRPISGRAGQAADGRAVPISHMAVMRFLSDVRPGDRLLYRGRRLEVVTAGDLSGRRAYLSCACSEMQVTG